MNSAIYTGWVRHRRQTPRPHAFRYRLCMLYLDLAELDTVFARRWFWSVRGRALAEFRRSDHFGDPSRPLADSVRALVRRETGNSPAGPVRLLTHLRYFGYCFNPISIFYCFDVADRQLEAMVVEVTNTPWGERQCYVLAANTSRPRRAEKQAVREHRVPNGLHEAPARSGPCGTHVAPARSVPCGTHKASARSVPYGTRHLFDKAMHVSPFVSMNQRYDWRCNVPAERLVVHMDVLQRPGKHEPMADGCGGASGNDPADSLADRLTARKTLDATLVLKRQPVDSVGLAQALLLYPFMTVKVIATIHWQALRLWLKGTPLVDHPGLAAANEHSQGQEP